MFVQILTSMGVDFYVKCQDVKLYRVENLQNLGRSKVFLDLTLLSMVYKRKYMINWTLSQ